MSGEQKYFPPFPLDGSLALTIVMIRPITHGRSSAPAGAITDEHSLHARQTVVSVDAKQIRNFH
jgi:hypothetical protein